MANLFRRFNSGGKDAIPSALREKQRTAEKMNQQLIEGRGILSLWKSILTRVKAVGSLQEQQRADQELSVMGGCFLNVIGANQILDLFDTAISSIDRKVKVITELNALCQRLEKIGQERDKFKRKRNEYLAKLQRKRYAKEEAKYAADYERTLWSYEELLCTANAEYDFLLQEARGGICSEELKFLKGYLNSVFPGCHSNQSLLPNMHDIRRYKHNFLVRREEFVSNRKKKDMQDKLLREGIISRVPLAKTIKAGSGASVHSNEEEETKLPFTPSSLSSAASQASTTADSNPVNVGHLDKQIKNNVPIQKPSRNENEHTKLITEKEKIPIHTGKVEYLPPRLIRRKSQVTEPFVQVVDFVDVPELPKKTFKTSKQGECDESSTLQNKCDDYTKQTPQEQKRKFSGRRLRRMSRSTSESPMRTRPEETDLEAENNLNVSNRTAAVFDWSECVLASNSTLDVSSFDAFDFEPVYINEDEDEEFSSPQDRTSPSLKENSNKRRSAADLAYARWSMQFDPKARQRPEFELLKEKMLGGFLVGRKDGWEEYVCRKTGENYWIHPNSMIVKSDAPPPPFSCLNQTA